MQFLLGFYRFSNVFWGFKQGVSEFESVDNGVGAVRCS